MHGDAADEATEPQGTWAENELRHHLNEPVAGGRAGSN